METIELHNRGEGETYLEHLDGKDWVLRCTPKYRQEYLRFLYDGDENNPIFKAVDPPGGPFISVGDKLSKGIVTRIRIIKGTGTVLTVEDESKEN